MKNGGKIIYYGPLGQHSSKVIEYFMVSSYILLKLLHIMFSSLLPNYNNNFQQ